MATGFYSHPDCLLHDNGQWHPECPARLQAIEDQLIASRIDALIEREEAPLAEEAHLARVHTQAHIDYIKSRTPESGRSELDPDTSMCPGVVSRGLACGDRGNGHRHRRTIRQRLLQHPAAGPSRRTRARDGLLSLQQRGDRRAPCARRARPATRRDRRFRCASRQRHRSRLHWRSARG